MTDTPPATLIERLARHLATHGDKDWPAHVEHAASLIAILKDPDPAMAAAGDADTWRRMIDAALTGRWTIDVALAGETGAGDAGKTSEAGSDEEGEIALPTDPVASKAAWVQTQDKGE